MAKKTKIKDKINVIPFTNEPLRLIDEEGIPLVDIDLEEDVGISSERIVQMYKDILLTREIDKMGWILARQGKAGFYISIGGQEGAHVGSLYALSKNDWVMPYYRSAPAMHIRGATLLDIFSQVLGTSLDPLKGRQMPGHFGKREIGVFVIGSVVGLGHVTAMGVAKALKYRGERSVVISYGGEGSSSEGHFHSAMNFSGVFKLPHIIFIQNNQYAISVPRSKQTASKTIAIKAKAYGFDGYFVDGNDPLIVYKVTKMARERAINGLGPTLIEALTYRLDPHSSSDNDTRYRSKGEVDEWRKKDPLIRMRKFLEYMKLWDEERERETLEKIRKDIEEAVEEAEKSGLPDPREMFEEVYSETPWYLKEEMEELTSFEDGGNL